MNANPEPPPAPRPARRRPAAQPRRGMPTFQHLRVIFAMVVREMSSTYGTSVGGYFWAVAQPLGGIALLTVAFGLALRAPPLGTSFALFYATGMMPFTVFSALSSDISGVIWSNRGLLTYPVVTILDGILAKVIFNIVTNGLVALLLFGGIIVGFGLHVTLAPEQMLLGMGMAALLGTGMGTLNCVLFGFFPTWKNIWSVLTKPLFLISGIFFTLESVPREFQHLLAWNPLIHVTGIVRAGTYREYDPQYVSHLYVLGWALGAFVIGAYLIRRHSARLIEA